MRLLILSYFISLSGLGQQRNPQLIIAEHLLIIDPAKAIKTATAAYNTAKQNADWNNTIASGFFLSNVYRQNGNFKLAAYYDSFAVKYTWTLKDTLLIQEALNNYATDKAGLGKIQEAENVLQENQTVCELSQNAQTMKWYETKGFCFYKQMNADDALSNFKKGLLLATSLNDPINVFRFRSLIAESLLRIKNKRDSINVLFEALEYLENAKDYFYTAEAASAIAFAFQTSFDYDKWLLYSQKALDLSSKGNNLYQVARMKIRIGEFYLDKKNYPVAKVYYTTANSYYHSIQNNPGLASSSISLGRLYTQIEEYDSAAYYFDVAGKLNTDLKLKSIEFALSMCRYILQAKMKNYKAADSSLANAATVAKHLDKDLINMALEKQKKGGFYSSEEVRKSDSFLHAIPKLNSSEIKSFGMTDKQIQSTLQMNPYTGSDKVLDSAYTERNLSSLYNVETQYRTRIISDSLRLQKQQTDLNKSKLRTRNITLAATAVLLLLVATGLYLQYRSRQRAERDKARIELLQNEIHHRVKNNLAVINRLVEVAGKNSVEDAPLSALKSRIKSIELLHNHLYSREAAAGNIALQPYLNDLCLAIAATFHSAKHISIRVNAPAEVDSAIAEKLGLIVNELVTNSYKYAFENREAGTVNITAQQEAGTLTVQVADNGIGMPETKTGSSYGMKLIKGLSHELKGRFNFHNENGTRFEIAIPVNA